MDDDAKVKIGLDGSEVIMGLDEIQGKLNEFATSFAVLGTGMSAALTAPIVGLAKLSYDAFSEIDGAMDNLRVKTGATGPALDALGESFRRVFADVPESAAKVGTAMAEIAAKTGQVGAPLEDLSKQFLNLSHVTGVDLSKNIETTTRLFGDWSIAVDQQSGTMDKLFRVTQATGQNFEEVGRSLVQYGGPLRQLGVDFDSAAAMISKFKQEGVNTELVLGGMRTALSKFGAAGKEPVQAFKDLVESIKSSDVQTGNLIAKQAVGARTFSDFAAAIREGRLDFDGLVETMKNGSDTIQKSADDTKDFAETWQIFKNKMTMALEPLGGALSKVFENLTPLLEPLIGLVQRLAEGFAHLSPTAQLIVVAIAAILAAAGPLTIALAGLAAAVSFLMGPVAMAGLLLVAKAVAIAVVAVAAAFAAWKFGEWLMSLKPVRDAFDALVSGLKQIWEWVMKIPGVSSLVKTFGDGWSWVKNQVDGLAKSGKEALSHVTNLGTAGAAAGAAFKGGSVNLDLFGKSAAAAAKEAEKLAKQVDASFAQVERMIAGFGKNALFDVSAWEASGNKVNAVVKSIDAEILKLTQQLSKIHDPEQAARIKGLIVNLEATKQTVKETAAEAEKLKLDQAFLKMDAAVKMAQKDLAALLGDLLKTDSGKTVFAAMMKDATDAAKAWKDIDDAAKAFGVTLKDDVTAKFDKLSTQFDVIVKLYREGKISAEEMARAQLKLAEASLEAAIKSGKSAEEIAAIKAAVDRAKESLRSFTPQIVEVDKAFLGFQADLKGVWADFKQGLADSITHWQGFGELVKSVWEGIKAAAVKLIVNEMFQAIEGSLKNGTSMFQEFGKSISNIFASLSKTISGFFSSLFGTGSSAASGAGGAGGAGGTVGGMMTGSLTGIVTAVSGVVSAITGFLSFLGQRRIEQDVGRIEVTTRGILNQLIAIQQRIDQWLPYLGGIQEAVKGLRADLSGLMASIAKGLQTLVSSMGNVASSSASVHANTGVMKSELEQQFGELRGIRTNTAQIANGDSLYAAMAGGFADLVAHLDNAADRVVNWLQASNKILVEIAQATAFTAQLLAKPGWQPATANSNVTQSGGNTNTVNMTNPTFSAFTPQQLQSVVKTAVSQALGRH